MSEEKWEEVGNMKEARAGHGVSIVGLEDYADWCTLNEPTTTTLNGMLFI